MDIVTKKCSKCGETRPLSEFYKSGKSRDGLHWRCKRCCKDQARQWALENPEKKSDSRARWAANHREQQKAAIRKWMREHPERGRVCVENRRARITSSGGKISTEEWQKVLEAHGNKCLRCGRDDVELTMDHIVPLSLGGQHTTDNVQPLCKSCNSSKSTKVMDYR